MREPEAGVIFGADWQDGKEQMYFKRTCDDTFQNSESIIYVKVRRSVTVITENFDKKWKLESYLFTERPDMRQTVQQTQARKKRAIPLSQITVPFLLHDHRYHILCQIL